MFQVYDIAIRDLIKVFTPGIPVLGLQNDDSSESSEMAMSQASGKDDKITFPVISVFRNPDIEITDGSMTKRASTSIGYSEIDYINYSSNSIVATRTTLGYTIDIFDLTRAAAEEIAMKLFFRLRNNPEVEVEFNFPGSSEPVICKAEIQLDQKVTNVRVQGLESSQLYKIRITLNLVNANVYELLERGIPKELRWTATATFQD